MIKDNKINCIDCNLVQVIDDSFKCIGFDSDFIQLIENDNKCNCFNYDLIQ